MSKRICTALFALLLLIGLLLINADRRDETTYITPKKDNSSKEQTMPDSNSNDDIYIVAPENSFIELNRL